MVNQNSSPGPMVLSMNMRHHISRHASDQMRVEWSNLPPRCSSTSRRTSVSLNRPGLRAMPFATNSTIMGAQSPLNQSARGGLKPILGCATEFAGRYLRARCLSIPFCRHLYILDEGGRVAANSTNSWSRNGDRSSKGTTLLETSNFVR